MTLKKVKLRATVVKNVIWKRHEVEEHVSLTMDVQ